MKFTIDERFGWVRATCPDGGFFESQHMEAFLLYAILQRLPDPTAPLPPAVEWENEAGTQRTTDQRMADNWQASEKVRVVRRAAT